MKQKHKKNILIVGLGLIGGSYAKGLKAKSHFIGAVTNDSSSIEYALKNKIIDEGATIPTKEFLQKYEIIIFALYPKVFLEWIKEYQHLIPDNTIITDVTGVKKCIVYDIQNSLRDTLEFIPAHPMAGKEVSGVENADPSIFKDANYIITPTSKNTEQGINIARYIGEQLNFNNISILSPEEHDTMIAFLSQLTHCIAVSLMCSKESRHLVEYTGDSFRDLTRIARINENMWSELFIMNKNDLVSQMDLFLNEFVKLKKAIEEEDINKMKQMMILSSERRSYFDKKGD